MDLLDLKIIQEKVVLFQQNQVTILSLNFQSSIICTISDTLIIKFENNDVLRKVSIDGNLAYLYFEKTCDIIELLQTIQNKKLYYVQNDFLNVIKNRQWLHLCIFNRDLIAISKFGQIRCNQEPILDLHVMLVSTLQIQNHIILNSCNQISFVFSLSSKEIILQLPGEVQSVELVNNNISYFCGEKTFNFQGQVVEVRSTNIKCDNSEDEYIIFDDKTIHLYSSNCDKFHIIDLQNDDIIIRSDVFKFCKYATNKYLLFMKNFDVYTLDYQQYSRIDNFPYLSLTKIIAQHEIVANNLKPLLIVANNQDIMFFQKNNQYEFDPLPVHQAFKNTTKNIQYQYYEFFGRQFVSDASSDYFSINQSYPLNLHDIILFYFIKFSKFQFYVGFCEDFVLFVYVNDQNIVSTSKVKNVQICDTIQQLNNNYFLTKHGLVYKFDLKNIKEDAMSNFPQFLGTGSMPSLLPVANPHMFSSQQQRNDTIDLGKVSLLLTYETSGLFSTNINFAFTHILYCQTIINVELQLKQSNRYLLIVLVEGQMSFFDVIFEKGKFYFSDKDKRQLCNIGDQTTMKELESHRFTVADQFQDKTNLKNFCFLKLDSKLICLYKQNNQNMMDLITVDKDSRTITQKTQSIEDNYIFLPSIVNGQEVLVFYNQEINKQDSRGHSFIPQPFLVYYASLQQLDEWFHSSADNVIISLVSYGFPQLSKFPVVSIRLSQISGLTSISLVFSIDDLCYPCLLQTCHSGIEIFNSQYVLDRKINVKTVVGEKSQDDNLQFVNVQVINNLIQIIVKDSHNHMLFIRQIIDPITMAKMNEKIQVDVLINMKPQISQFKNLFNSSRKVVKATDFCFSNSLFAMCQTTSFSSQFMSHAIKYHIVEDNDIDIAKLCNYVALFIVVYIESNRLMIYNPSFQQNRVLSPDQEACVLTYCTPLYEIGQQLNEFSQKFLVLQKMQNNTQIIDYQIRNTSFIFSNPKFLIMQDQYIFVVDMINDKTQRNEYSIHIYVLEFVPVQYQQTVKLRPQLTFLVTHSLMSLFQYNFVDANDVEVTGFKNGSNQTVIVEMCSGGTTISSELRLLEKMSYSGKL